PRLPLRLHPGHLRVRPDLVDPAAVLAGAEPGAAVPLRRVQPVPAPLPPRPAAARAARPLAGRRGDRPLRAPAGARRALRTTSLRKGAPHGTHTRRDPSHPTRPVSARFCAPPWRRSTTSTRTRTRSRRLHEFQAIDAAIY